ncbi:MAG: sigma-70 family RNA polymerase sigma factor [Acidimicrobiales bacterium]
MTHGGAENRAAAPTHEADPDLTAAAAAVRLLLRSRLRDAEMVDDLHQETMERVLRVRGRLDPSTVVPYAVTVAKNLVVGNARHQSVADRNQHRLADQDAVEGLDEHLLREEDRVAVSAALDGLSTDARAELVAHVIEGRSTIDLADRAGGSAGGIAARLARSRARMRLDSLLAVRKITLPTPDCHPVLLAFSAADRRRQEALGAADHLLVCDACRELAPPLLERRRALVGLVPVPALAPVLGTVARLARRRWVQVGTGAAAVSVGVAAAIALQPAPSPQATVRTTTSAPPSPSTTASSAPAPIPSRLELADRPALDILASGSLARFAGRPVEADAATVESVSADEGFWLGQGPGQRIWVQLIGQGESPIEVEAGKRMSFSGRLVVHGADYSGGLGLDPAEAAELTAAGAHIEVATDAVTVRNP